MKAGKRLLSCLLAITLVFGMTPIGSVFAANSLAELIAQAPAGARVFNADGDSGNGLNGPNTLWWDYHPTEQSGDVWMLVASNNAGKIATAAQLGGKTGIIIDSVEKGNADGTAYTLIKFTDIWLTGDEDFDVSMNNDGSFKGGQWISGNLRDYFPQLVSVTYFDPAGKRLGADTLLVGEETTVWSWTATTGYKFEYWIDDDGNTYEAGEKIPVDKDLNLYAFEEPDTFGYVVEYYYDGIIDSSKTFTGSALFGNKVDAYPSKLEDGYELESDTAPLTITEIAANNVIRVYYVKRTDLPYRVEYYYDGAIDNSKTDTFPNQTFGTVISTYTDKVIDGYRYVSDTAPITIGTGDNVIKVYYVKRTDLSYSVEYYYDGVIDNAKTDTFNNQTFGTEITNYTGKLIDGYKLESDTAPITIGTSVNVIKVYYVKRTDLPYTVEYYYDGVIDNSKTDTIPNKTFGEVISTYTDKVIDGYELDDDTAPITIGTGVNVIKVYYVKRTDLSYSVEYYYEGTIDNTKTDTFNNQTFGTEISTYTDKVIDGYKLESDTAPITIGTSANVIKVYYVKRKDLSYTVEYYYDGVIDNSKTDTFNNQTFDTVIDTYTDKVIDGYELDTDTAPITIGTGANVIKVYYKKVIFTVTYNDGGMGFFTDEVYGNRHLGDPTPGFTGDLNIPGWEFTGWSPTPTATVTADVTYVAQWYRIPYTVIFDFGGKGGDIDPYTPAPDSRYTSRDGYKLTPSTGDLNNGSITYAPLYWDEGMPVAPWPYAEFGYKFKGWSIDGGKTVAYPTNASLPPLVEGSVTFTAVFEKVDNTEWPDKIPSLAHHDKWWDAYGIFCASSSNGAMDYTLGFSDDFWTIYRRVSIGFGVNGNMDFVVTFVDGAWSGNIPLGVVFDPKKVDDSSAYGPLSSSYNSARVNYTYDFRVGGAWSIANPYVTGSRQAWLGSPQSFGVEPPVPGVPVDPIPVASAVLGKEKGTDFITVTVKYGADIFQGVFYNVGKKNTITYPVSGYNVAVEYDNGGKIASCKII